MMIKTFTTHYTKFFFLSLLIPSAALSQIEPYYNCKTTSGGRDLGLARVTLGSIDNITTVPVGTGGFGTCTAGAAPVYVRDYTGLSTNISKGSTYVFQAQVGNYAATCGAANGTEVFLFIDYDHNGLFEGSEYALTLCGLGANVTSSGNFTVPVNAITGTTRMRVIATVGTATCPKINPAGDFVSAEVEDYTVNIVCTTSMTFQSCTTTQLNTSLVVPGYDLQEIIGMQVVTNSGCTPIAVTEFSFNTTGNTGTTAPLTDIKNARLWTTFGMSAFATRKQLGTAIASPNGAFLINGFSYDLLAGTNYFWLTYDIPTTATSGNLIDALCDGITIGGVAQIPTMTNPLGERSISGTTYVVNSNNDVDDGTCDATHCSLREAINASNVDGVPSVITFNISGGATQTISLLTLLPFVSDNNTVIDGYTQPGTVANTNTTGPLNGTPGIVISNGASLSKGVVLTGNDNVIRGLVIPNFGDGTITRDDDAVLIRGGSRNQVLGCYIGMDVTGTTKQGGNLFAGVRVVYPTLTSATGYNVIGNGTPEGRNLISGFSTAGAMANENASAIVLDSGATGNIIRGNILGLTKSGSIAISNSAAVGISIQVRAIGANWIGGLNAGDGNIISSHQLFGLYDWHQMTTGGIVWGDTIMGNYIGTDHSGMVQKGNRIGLCLENAYNCQIGDTSLGGRNIISGNGTVGGGGGGIEIAGSVGTGHVIIGNLVGTDATGVGDLGNAFYGISVENSSGFSIGGTAPGAGNIIAGNDVHGIQLYTTSNNCIRGNTIGLSPTCKNLQDGINIRTASGDFIGDLGGGKNTIQYNGAHGVHLNDIVCRDNILFGNKISNNTGNGIYFQVSWLSDNDNVRLTYNTISSNGINGIYFEDQGTGSSDNDVISFNTINANAQNGIYMNMGSNTITGSVLEQNKIYSNGMNGISFGSYITGSQIIKDTIYSNGRNGILIASGGTSNLDLITRCIIYNNGVGYKPINLSGSGNANYAKPIISSANTTLVSGTAAVGDTVEVFSSIGADANCINLSVFLGSTIAGAGGAWSLPISINSGDVVKATARNVASKNTSESSLCTTALPVELLTFTAQSVNNKQVLCRWTTSVEINNDFFDVERSKYGDSWEFVGKVKGAGNSSTSLDYSLTDCAPYQGTSYYRLKQVDYNGDITYHGPVAVNLEGIEIIGLYPNPAGAWLKYVVVSSMDETIQFNIVDNIGRSVVTETQEIKMGENKFSVDVSGYAAGLYLVRLMTQSGKYRTQKQFIKK